VDLIGNKNIQQSIPYTITVFMVLGIKDFLLTSLIGFDLGVLL
jgi:hypothetical protein